jgi:hypothetical protein
MLKKLRETHVYLLMNKQSNLPRARLNDRLSSVLCWITIYEIYK